MDSPAVTTRRQHPVTGLERGLALGPLGCGLLLAVAIVVFAVRNLVFLVLALLGLGAAVSGLWWAVAERTARRGIGIAWSVVGVALVLVAVAWVTPHGAAHAGLNPGDAQDV